MASPPGSPADRAPAGSLMRPPRTASRLSMTSKGGGGCGGGSRASDEDSRTSVKVVVRVRPPLQPSDPGYELIPQRFQRSMVQVTSATNLVIDSPQGRKLFVFDRVFGEDIDQAGIWEYLVESTNAFVQGYNVSMLAYGQSGAGKSYTMGTSGPSEQEDLDGMGVIPRAATALFEKLESLRPNKRNSMSGLKTPTRYSATTATMLSSKHTEKNWTLKASYVEIYNEQLRDLLLPETTPSSERANVTIREDVKGHIILTGLHQIEINSVEDMMAALNYGSTIRQTDSTAINAKSSRSHAVFSLNLIQHRGKSGTGSCTERRFSVPFEAMTGSETTVTIDSKFHFVDLAGSERLKNTGAQGERAKEGISINAGLASLGKVISQLSSRQAGSHVSYRDSKLTRLLQDSLGGNAITYMIACVTPAEFHLSETLNTVQYAQRARAIQSKPRIQQVAEEGDKQALIERLKAEVAFLRDQIRSTERGGDRRSHASAERPERQNEREMDLQNQLLDIQENYTALSQRHAKLISELAKARDTELAENQALEETLGDSATERLKRSNSFAEAVEQVVLEYEKTIQSLEQSLSSIRGSLSNTEANLLEKETKCAYVETVNQQLQVRLQKMIDRESSTENYLHDLETKLDGHTSGEEKNSAIVMELRKEIARVRENEAACEDYISTLEERLAEADQDTELMQREIDRLEHVVERQRSLGKLDNLLYELDHIHTQRKKGESETLVNGSGKHISPIRTREHSAAGRLEQKGIISEAEEDELAVSNPENHPRCETEGPVQNGESIALKDKSGPNEVTAGATNLSQYKFVEDKLENVTQELFDLRVEHESTVNEFDLLSAKYEEALRTLAELQDAVDEARHPPPRNSILSDSLAETSSISFLVDSRASDPKDGGKFSSSRSLSLELSSAGEFPSSIELSDVKGTPKTSENESMNRAPIYDDTIAAEVEHLRKLAEEQDQAQKLLVEKFSQLEEEHMSALDLVEELKSEVSKAKISQAESPRSSTPVIRRKSSQNVMIIDKAHRAFASLRNIGTESFEGSPDVMANFELNLNTAMHELHARSERVQELEADISSVRKEMETKMTIISGLTRERSSLQSSPMDMSVVSTMRDQLLQSENQMRLLRETHLARERELLAEISDLQASLDARDNKNLDNNPGEVHSQTDINELRVSELEAELAAWQDRHAAALKSMELTEKDLRSNIQELEGQLSHARVEQVNASVGQRDELAEKMQRELNDHKATLALRNTRIAELEELHVLTKQQLEEASKTIRVAHAEVSDYKSLLVILEQQISEHESIVRRHRESMSLLHSNYAKEIDGIKASTRLEYEARVAKLDASHEQRVQELEAELTESQDELTKLATQIEFSTGVDVSTEKLQEKISDLLNDQKALSEKKKEVVEKMQYITELDAVNKSLSRELEFVQAEVASLLLDTVEGTRSKDPRATVTDQLATLRKEITELTAKNDKSCRLVQELEDQLAINYDQHQVFNNRLSTLQTERHAQLEEANATTVRVRAELDALREEYTNLQARYEELEPGAKRSNSTGRLRKSPSAASLPSPPPAIPLPPLPGAASSSSPTGHTSVSPTPGQMNRPNSKDLALQQIQDDQEARIFTIERHLTAEKQLTQTLEEALTELENQTNRVKADGEHWRIRCAELETEIKNLKEREKTKIAEKENRWSMLQVEEERKKRRDAEIARAHLEERMNAISKKKKKGSLNCF